MKKLFTLIGAITLVVLNGQLANASGFTDVPQDHPYRDAIEYNEKNGIVSGNPDGTFKPDRHINRAEFTKIIIGAQFTATEIDTCITENVPETSPIVFFPDVPKNAWFAKYICVAKKNTIIHGYPDGSFSPDNFINIAEAAKIISNAFGYLVKSDDIWYKPYIEQLGMRNAIPTTIKNFDANITRGEVAEIIYRLKANITTKESMSYESIRQLDSSPKTITIQVFFPTLKDNENMINCSKVEAVSRTLPYTTATARAALDQLFLGPTEQEKANGMSNYPITTETAYLLKRIFIQNGTAYLDWKEELMEEVSSGGTSCGGSVFGSAIYSTLLQFPSVTRVIHAIEGEPARFYGWNQRGCSVDDEFGDLCDETPYKTANP